MRVLSHRGWWRSTSEKNTETAFRRSFDARCGTETDVRDMDGVLVISHDPPRSEASPLPFDAFLDIYVDSGAHDRGLPLALNIKADGLASALEDELRRRGVDRHAFVFDMSVPDMRSYVAGGLDVFTRHSELEPAPALYKASRGVWLDAFHDEAWIAPEILEGHLAAGKSVCIVSPELHGREPTDFWRRLRDWIRHRGGGDGLMMCTDLPAEAKEVFGDDD